MMEIKEDPIIIDYIAVLGRNMATIGKSIRNAIKQEIGEDTVKGDSIKIAVLGITKEGSSDLLTLPIKIPPGEFKEMAKPKTSPKESPPTTPPGPEMKPSGSGATPILSEQEITKIEKLKAVYNDPETSAETKEMVKNRLIELGVMIE